MAVKKSLLFEVSNVQSPSRVINLGFINLGLDAIPKTGKKYPIVLAND